MADPKLRILVVDDFSRTLQEVLTRAVHGTFNMLTVDGEMSTNDTVLALANGLAGNPRLAEPCADLDPLRDRAHRPARRDGPRHGGRRRGGHQALRGGGGRGPQRRGGPRRGPRHRPVAPRRRPRSSAPIPTGGGCWPRWGAGPARRAGPSIPTRPGSRCRG